MLIDTAVGLGEALFRLPVTELPIVDVNHFLNPIGVEHSFLFSAPADDLAGKCLGNQRRGVKPIVFERSMIDQRDEELAAQR